ncbi:DNA cross-link repair protein PSO2/SNM1 [Taxawa tesnikishii (nom. ined.)]|nr:DNA cross-link repair protein PSO2/SNM1 [Dothideales sp. JES 119]
MVTKTIGPKTPSGSKRTPLPTIGRGSTNPKRSSANNNAKPKGKPNASILSFFKKTDGPADELFVQGRGGLGPAGKDGPSPDALEELEDEMDLGFGDEQGRQEEEERYHENGGPVKRRRLSGSEDGVQANGDGTTANKEPVVNPGPCSPPPPDAPGQIPAQTTSNAAPKRSGPFFEESDSEDDDTELDSVDHVRQVQSPPLQEEQKKEDVSLAIKQETRAVEDDPPGPPLLSRAGTNYGEVDGFADFEGLEDFEDDVYEEGDEFVERRYMEEQARLEANEAGVECDLEERDESPDAAVNIEEPTPKDAPDGPSCPICSIGLGGISDQDAAIHVNNCLDGNPSPLPTSKKPAKEEPKPPGAGQPSAGRFKSPQDPPNRDKRIPSLLAHPAPQMEAPRFPNSCPATPKMQPGPQRQQQNTPLAGSQPIHAPILPGFFICVDAFRYGAVEGCKAYFLSHFHSDHYVGLTSTWCHGPIYCSRVTANLVRQQLRVDPKWVIPLEFEQVIEVPGTQGVSVTMIPANHCPGSSLYLFEKTIGKGANPKVQRVLHCGDFRACRAHIEHPLLRPDVMDAVSGRTRQQKIDVCYLDTTYLNPKYAFPSQEEVIQACADMCVSLNKVRADENDGWEQMKRERAGAGMAKFVRKDSDVAIKQEDQEGEDADPAAATTEDSKERKRTRGRLLVVVGTYSIGKERVCLGIARALGSKIYAPPAKQRICACLEDRELSSLLTDDPREAQVHMTPLFEIRADTLDDYLKDYRDAFARCVGFRPSGWNYRPPNTRFVESPSVQTVLRSSNWRSAYGMKDLVPQRGSTTRASCFGVPYSEHSSFRELTMFCCALRIEKVIPTVNVGNAKSRERMKGWAEKWAMERKKNGLFKVEEGNW